jgi:hypothetical protein
MDGREGDCGSFFLIGELRVDDLHHLIWIEDLNRVPFPQLRVEADGAKSLVMGFRERLQADVGAFESNGL